MKRFLAVSVLVLLATAVVAAPTANVLISWNANTESDLAGYYVFWNGTQVATVTAPAHTWAGAVELVEGNNIAQVSAFDKCTPPNVSGKSAVTSQSTLVYDSTAPAVPGGCLVQPQ